MNTVNGGRLLDLGRVAPKLAEISRDVLFGDIRELIDTDIGSK
ncbi:hypothetical protein [Noviherbaspirillum saxi]|nr:hypothetical protein [Noviherbaspirillum saxi]